jgi:sortase A
MDQSDPDQVAPPSDDETPSRELPARGRRSRRLRLLGDLLLIAGGLVLAYPFWSAAYAQVQQSRLDSTYRDQTAAFVEDVSANVETPTRRVPDEELVRRLAVRYRRGLKAGDPIGRLRIPHIDLDRLVQQGVGGRLALDPDGDRALLRSGPVHYAVTPLPGLGEPFAVAGHRTTYGAPFFKLDDLRKGDRIFMDTPYAKFRYAVAKTTTVDPADIGVLSDRGYGLVLTTCTPPYSAEHRLIVWAELEKVRPLRAARGR